MSPLPPPDAGPTPSTDAPAAARAAGPATTDQTPPPTGPAPARRSGATARWLVAGLVVGAVLASLVWLVLGSGDDDPEIDTRAVELPSELGSYVSVLDAAVAQGLDEDRVDEFEARTDRYRRRAEEQVSAAYAGAGSGVARYASDDFEQQVTAVAVRAPSPGVFAVQDFADPADVGAAVNLQRVETVGEVDCVVVNEFVPAGDEVDPESRRVISCQRSGPDLTVIVFGAFLDPPQESAAVVDDLFESITDG